MLWLFDNFIQYFQDQLQEHQQIQQLLQQEQQHQIQSNLEQQESMQKMVISPFFNACNCNIHHSSCLLYVIF